MTALQRPQMSSASNIAATRARDADLAHPAVQRSAAAPLKSAVRQADSFAAQERILQPRDASPGRSEQAVQKKDAPEAASATPATAAPTEATAGPTAPTTAGATTEATGAAAATTAQTGAENVLPPQEEPEAPGASAASEAFAAAFNKRFATVIAPAFGGPLDGVRAATFFSPEQQAMLLDFMNTDTVPKSLFISAPSTGALKAGQRILISSTILAQGKVVPDSDGNDVPPAKKAHAQFCGHWTRWVYSYAGVTPPNGVENFGGANRLDMVGPTGEISLGGGQRDKAARGVKGKEAEPSHEGQLRPVFDGDEVFEALQPGDWLYVDNGCPAGHSVIFAGWAGNVQNGAEGTRYRTATLFSQLNNNPKKGDPGGGSKHTYKLGYPYSKAAGVFPVTALHRVTEDSGPPTTEDAILAFDRAKAVTENAKKFARVKAFAPKKAALDVAKVSSAVLEQASAMLADPALKSLAPAQRTLCEGIISGHSGGSAEDLASLVALCQRFAGVTRRLGQMGGVSGIVDPLAKDFSKMVGGRSLDALREDA